MSGHIRSRLQAGTAPLLTAGSSQVHELWLALP